MWSENHGDGPVNNNYGSEYAEKITTSMREMTEKFVAEQGRTNELIKKDQEDSDARRVKRRHENIWYGFATSLVSEGKTNIRDIGDYADMLLKQHLERYPS